MINVDELVKQLQVAASNALLKHPLSDQEKSADHAAIRAAITHIQSQADGRDAVLEEAAVIADGIWVDLETGESRTTGDIANAIRALKSQPAAQPQMTPEEYRDFWNGKNPERAAPQPEKAMGESAGTLVSDFLEMLPGYTTIDEWIRGDDSGSTKRRDLVRVMIIIDRQLSDIRAKMGGKE